MGTIIIRLGDLNLVCPNDYHHLMLFLLASMLSNTEQLSILFCGDEYMVFTMFKIFLRFLVLR